MPGEQWRWPPEVFFPGFRFFCYFSKFSSPFPRFKSLNIFLFIYLSAMRIILYLCRIVGMVPDVYGWCWGIYMYTPRVYICTRAVIIIIISESNLNLFFNWRNYGRHNRKFEKNRRNICCWSALIIPRNKLDGISWQTSRHLLTGQKIPLCVVYISRWRTAPKSIS
jgi:hypothetical protein